MGVEVWVVEGRWVKKYRHEGSSIKMLNVWEGREGEKEGRKEGKREGGREGRHPS